MILIDGSQFFLSDATVNWANSKEHFTEKYLLQCAIVKLAKLVKFQKREFGTDVVICLDEFQSWRKKEFSFYKEKRKTKRSKSDFPWEKYYSINKFVIENFKKYVPIKTISCEDAEADDIIAVLAKEYCPIEKIFIWSSDSDFLQLQTSNNVKQYSYIMKEWIKTKDAIRSLNEKIVFGDEGDGIPNCLSDVDTFVCENKRQKSMTQEKKMILLHGDSPEKNAPTNEILSRIEQNRKLIDFNKIPDYVRENILNKYKNVVKPAFGNFQIFLLRNGYENLTNVSKDLR